MLVCLRKENNYWLIILWLIPLYIMVGSSSAGDAADFVTNRFLYSSIISFTSSSGTFSLLFIICTNLLSDIRPVFWGSKDLHRENNFYMFTLQRGENMYEGIMYLSIQYSYNTCSTSEYSHITGKCPANILRLAPLFFAGK